MNGLSPTPTPPPVSTPRVFTLRELPLPARLTLSVFLLAVGAGYFSALVQLHFRHASRGNPLPTADDVVAKFSGVEHFWTGKKDGEANASPPRPVSKLERLIMGPIGEKEAPFDGSGSMAPVFFTKDSKFKKLIAQDPTIEPKLRSEREGERLALQAWINTPDEERKKSYEEDAFPLPEALLKQPITKTFRAGDRVKVQSLLEARCLKCHTGDEGQGKADLTTYEALEKFMEVPRPVVAADGNVSVKSSRQMSVERLTESTHLHALSFAVLFMLTGLIFAFSSYPLWMRSLLAPLVLLVQMIDVSCWWLARLDGIGPYFALTILVTGSIVGAGLALQIVLSLFNMYRWAGKLVLVVIFAAAAAGGGYLAPKIQDELNKEVPQKPAPAAAAEK